MEVVLNLKVYDGKLYRDTELAGKMDPYVSIEIDGQKLKTKVHDNAGKYPKWDQDFSVKTKLNTTFNYKVLDHETLGSDDLIGEGSFELVKNYLLIKKLISAPISFKGELSGEVRMEIQLIADEKFHKQIRQEIEADLKEKQSLVEALKKGEKKELPKQLIYQPPAPKKGDALEEAEEKELKEELAALQKELAQVKNTREVRENDRSDMLKRMLSGNLIHDQLKKHTDQVKSQIEDFRRRDIQGKVIVKILRAKLNANSNDPVVYVTLGNKYKKTKTQDEDNKNPMWNQTLEFDRSEKDESALLFWVLDEGFNHNIIGYTGLSIYSAIFSKLDEKYNLPLLNGDKNVGELVLHVCFKRK